MHQDIERVENIFSGRFKEDYMSKSLPVIISGGLDWPAFKWTPNTFKQNLPDQRVSINVIGAKKGEDRAKYVRKTKVVTVAEAVDLITNNKNPNIKYYLMQKSVYEDYPQLISDFSIPIWVDDIEAAWSIEERKRTVNIWFGEAGNNTPLHYDSLDNLLVQIFGRKYVRLFPPADTPFLYRHTPESGGLLHLSQITNIDYYDQQKNTLTLIKPMPMKGF